jgi:hypothetical protein
LIRVHCNGPATRDLPVVSIDAGGLPSRSAADPHRSPVPSHHKKPRVFLLTRCGSLMPLNGKGGPRRRAQCQRMAGGNGARACGSLPVGACLQANCSRASPLPPKPAPTQARIHSLAARAAARGRVEARPSCASRSIRTSSDIATATPVCLFHSESAICATRNPSKIARSIRCAYC